LTRKAVFGVLQGADWVGMRVRAPAHRVPRVGETEEEVCIVIMCYMNEDLCYFF
jgi:hypothetical protein